MQTKNDTRKELITVSINPISKLILGFYSEEEKRSFSGTVNWILENFIEENELKNRYYNLIEGVLNGKNY